MSEIIVPNVFARVEGNVVLEYPVTAEMIRNRQSPLTMFRAVKKIGNLSTPGRFQRVVEGAPKVVDRYVVVEVSIQDFSLNEVLSKLLAEYQQTDPGATAVPITSVTMDVVQLVSHLTEMEITDRLEKLAQSRRYKGIDSAGTFKDSHVEKYRLQAERMIYLRSEVFHQLELYEMGVVTGQLPVPRSLEEIMSHLPTIDWGQELLDMEANEQLLLQQQMSGGSSSGSEGTDGDDTPQNPVDPIMSM